MDKEKNEIILFENQGIKLEVNVKDDTVWLTQDQMSKLFGKAKSTINEHIKNIFKENELQENETMTKFGNSEFSDKPTNYYNLDMIISVGYRVKSQQGIAFRKWSTKVLKDYMLKGYAINQKRLEYLEKTVQLIDIANRIDNQVEADEIKNVLKVIGEYTKALDLLDSYDYRTIKKIKGTDSLKQIKYEDCKLIIENLKFNEKSNLFAVERDRGLEAIIGNIYQSFDGEYIYKSVEEKAANFLYLIVKNHVFVDGNKRIAATLFIYFLEFYNILYKDNRQVIDNNTLAALTLLIA
ncbi:MAG: virulence protein RhuM/Fic/DOC family protein, partial [Clostridiales bacterium]|nr:virulence protein RhuM/Fic/DOC family protein [Clostridiales bacterium]